MNKCFSVACFLLLLFSNIYGQVSPKKDLYLYYPLNGNAVDHSNNDHNGTVFGALPTSDRFGNSGCALVFNGINNYITLNKTLPDMARFSISVWVYHTKRSGLSGIFSDADSAMYNDLFFNISNNEVGIDANKQPGGNVNKINLDPLGNFSSPVIDQSLNNAWHHIVWVCDSTSQKIYIDTVLKSTIDITGVNIGYHNTAASIGRIGDGVSNGGYFQYFHGHMDDFRLYSKDLSFAEVKSLFTVPDPPFWKTWWFIAFLIVTWIVLTYQLIKWRIKKFKKKIEEKNKITKQLTEYQLTAIQAQMNPHFIFNVITSIQNFILDKDTDEAYDYLAQFARLIRLILQHSKENYISIEKELEMLKIYISLEQLRLNKKFDFVVKLSSEVDESSELLPVMLLQPYIENSIWHGIMPMDKSKKGVITLSITRRNKTQLEITIEDNGVGRSKATELRKKTEHTSMAMTLNQKRLELFNAEMKVIDKYDENNIATGTRIELVI